jgi:RHS repeat-associated protein
MGKFLLQRVPGWRSPLRALGLVLILVLWAGAPDRSEAQEQGTPGSELALLAARFEEPLIATAPTTAAEDAALLQAIRTYEGQSAKDNFQPFDAFLATNPDSGWRVALLTNLGLSYYRYGFFSRAITAWEHAWQEGRAVTEEHGKALVDRAVGELLRMHARLGHSDELAALFADLGDRDLTGPATETKTGASEGLWMMRNDPGVAYLCGPIALKNLLLALGKSPDEAAFLDEVRSGPRGVTLAEVARLADRAKLTYRLIQREPGQPIPIPSIVHWKVNHFAAIVGEDNNLLRVEDPTFGETLWISRAALDQEASGYFLVPDGAGPFTWRDAQPADVGQVFGKGYTQNNNQNNNPDDTRPDNTKAKPCGSGPGMCDYNFTEMVVSLNLQDIPVGYTPPKGPRVKVAITYNQREASQPANFSFFNVSPKWTLNWLSYITDNPRRPGELVSRYVAGGGKMRYTGYNSGTGAFTRETVNGALLVRTSSTTYERRLSDGSVETYAQSNGATSFPRLLFLTRVTNPFGNSVVLNYDSQIRLTSIIDATGRSSTFTYGLPARPLLVTQITDPFGRSAQLNYDASGRLSQITDVLGLTSQFAYDSRSLVNALTTPYGTTNFTCGDNGNTRFLTATDPLGYTERLEFLQGAPGIPWSDPPNTVPVGLISMTNVVLTGRNTFYWDKHAYRSSTDANNVAVASSDYTKARNRHWTHLATNHSLTAEPVESIKYPFENRIWFNYLGQPAQGTLAVSGTLDKPIRIGRVLDDGSTQLTQLSYNSAGRVTSITDPVGRQTQLQYASNGIDLTQVQQKTSASGFSTIAQFTYNTQHLPLTYTDAAGQTTSYAYNSAGQLTSVTNALSQVTSFQYDNIGYLVSVTNANGATALILTYDALGRVATRTDSEGLMVSYSYDALDRVTRETYADGTTRDYTWTRLDLTAMKDRQGRVTSFAYDAVRNLTSVTDPLGQQTSLGYFENQKLKTLTDPNGHATNWSIDVQGRLTAKQYADGTTVGYAYENTTSRLKTITDALGQKTQYTYAVDDQPTAIQYLNAINATPNVSFAYDAFLPRVTSMTDGTGMTGYVYQPVGALGALQLAGENGPYTNSAITYQYDALGRVSSRSVSGNAETYAYDALGRLTSRVNALGSFTLGYLGQTSQLTGRSNGVVETSWSYDSNTNDRRLTAIVNGGQARSFNYTTTPENDITGITELDSGTQQSWSYSYDAADRLTNATLSSGGQYTYGYDAAGNIASIQRPAGSAAIGYNSVNQVTTYNGAPFTYDANGNLLQDDLRTYRWDAANRLIEVSLIAQGVQATFSYDGAGRRIAIKTAVGAANSEEHYLWCGQRLCQARNVADVPTRRYFVEGEEIAGAALLYYASDQLGSVRDVLDPGSGSVVASSDYEPDGAPTASFFGQFPPHFRYAGLFYHQQSGLYLASYRAYDSRTSRWLSRDPIGEIGGGAAANLYTYVSGNPISHIDALGLLAGIWIEGGSPGEFAFHESLAIGDPNGTYWTYSFGLDDSLFHSFGGQGRVYPDTEQGGPISDYYEVPDVLLPEIVMLLNLEYLGKKGTYNLATNNCRDWSQRTERELIKKYNLQPASPPPWRPINGWRPRPPPFWREPPI